MPKLVRVALKTVAVSSVIVGTVLLIAQDQETLRIRSAVAADDPRALAYVARLVGTPVSSGSSYQILTNGDEIFPAMLAAVDAARTRISFETYIYDQGDIANRFTAAFENAAKRGVQVNLVIDSVGSGAIDDEHVRRLRAAGCQLETFNAASWWELEEVNYRTHRKILVVDGDTAFVGGVGIADHWLGNAQDFDHWRDTQVMMRGPIALSIEAAFYENFIESGDVVTPVLDDGAPGSPQEGNAFIVRSSPTGGSSDLKRLYLLLIAIARKQIDITSPYFVTDESTMWALQEALGRGVRIRILTESDLTDARPVKYASRAAYRSLLERRVELYEYQPSMMHAKVIVVDDRWSMFGSANFDNRSLELNDELNVAVRSGDLATRFTAQFERDLQVSRRLDLASWRARSLVERARERFWSAFGEVF